MFQSRYRNRWAVWASAIVLAACAPVADEAAEVAEVTPAEQVRQPIYRSDKRLSSDCGVDRAPRPVPGLATVAGDTPGELSEDNVRQLAIWAYREGG